MERQPERDIMLSVQRQSLGPLFPVLKKPVHPPHPKVAFFLLLLLIFFITVVSPDSRIALLSQMKSPTPIARLQPVIPSNLETGCKVMMQKWI